MRGGITVPCRGCKDRTEKCHGNCERYKEFLKRNEEIKSNKKKVSINRSTIFRPKYFKD
jgi:hypothetical protein